jgi:redox-sensitive bicupin YhaK (pirin superfamily)
VLGAEVVAAATDCVELPLDRDFEHAIMLIDGQAALGDRVLTGATLYYLGIGRPALSLTMTAGSRLMLLGGEPFGERIVMWWNFVARMPEEIAAERHDWEEGRGFGTVPGYVGDRIPAPPLVLRPSTSE